MTTPVGEVIEAAPGVRRLFAPNPGIMTGPGTNPYLLGPDDVAVVDDSHLAAILAAAGDRIGWMQVTHTHVDHSPLAERLKATSGALALRLGPARA